MRRKQIKFCVYNKSGCEPDGEHFCHFTLKCSGCRPTNISQKLQKGREIYDFTAFLVDLIGIEPTTLRMRRGCFKLCVNLLSGVE